MSRREYIHFLNDIKDCSKNILEYVSGKSFEQFLGNRMLIDAVMRNIEIIGEAVKNLPAKVRSKHPRIEWKRLAGLRDIVIHHYFGLDYQVIWDIVQKDIPDLVPKIEEVIAAETKGR